MPLHAVALGLLKKTGPLAVSSANYSGQPPATTADDAVEQLGESVAVYLDGGKCPGDVPSTIVDLTGSVPRLLRPGVITPDRLREVVPLVDGEAFQPDPGERPDPEITGEPGTEDGGADAPDSGSDASDSQAGKVAGVPDEADESDGVTATELTADQNGAAPEPPGQVL
jgi:L-threonylcarbamoyladenylate synthase